MRRFALALSVLLLSTHAMAADLATIGQPAPDFTATNTLSGKEVKLSALRGQPVVLELNNFDCPFVKAHYKNGDMQALQKRTVESGVVWLSINSSAAGKEGYLADAAAAKTAASEHQSNASAYLLDHDGTIGRAYGASPTPHMFVIDKNGTLVYSGAINDKASANADDIKNANNYVTAALAALKDGKPVEPAHTRPYGCGVKYGF